MLKNILILGTCALALAGLAGCGGNGSSHSLSPFTGTYSGTWSSPSMNDGGTATITVDFRGHLTGTTHDNGLQTDGTLEGTVTPSGEVTGTVTYPESSSSALTGTFAFQGQDQVVGNLDQHFGEQLIPVTFVLDRQ